LTRGVDDLTKFFAIGLKCKEIVGLAAFLHFSRKGPAAKPARTLEGKPKK
jgi:hypothetical protein